MQEMQRFVAGLVVAVARVVGWLLMAVVALVLLGLALLLLAVGLLWALVRGRRPEPAPFMAQFQRYAAGRVWPGAKRPGPSEGEVVDADIREVPDDTRALQPPAPGDGVNRDPRP